MDGPYSPASKCRKMVVLTTTFERSETAAFLMLRTVVNRTVIFPLTPKTFSALIWEGKSRTGRITNKFFIHCLGRNVLVRAENGIMLKILFFTSAIRYLMILHCDSLTLRNLIQHLPFSIV